MQSSQRLEALLNGWLAEATVKAKAGRVPTYIPRLATVSRDWLSVQIQLIDGEVFAAGEIDQPFALMSVVKPLLLLFLLEEIGAEAVFETVGVSPSDQPFHSLRQLSIDRGFPRNPMINSGAIALADLLPGEEGKNRCATLCQWLNQVSGAHFELDEALLASVRSVSNETNWTLATLLNKAGYLHSIETALDTYNHICCLSGTVKDLVKVGMVLASRHETISATSQRTVNALMLSCGLYEASGTFAVKLGVPTKSGVSGALLAVIPRRGTIACYSPPLDDAGNSIAGLFLLEKIIQTMDFNIFG